MSARQSTAGLARHAVDYAALGFGVFPVKPRSKQPLTRHGFRDATTRLEQIEDWWRCWPDANIGLAVPAELVVLDVDSEEALHRMHLEDLRLPATVKARTGRGYHFWYATEGKTFKNGVDVLPGVDLRTAGGYVIVPPSIHPSGEVYEWDVPLDPTNIAPVPDWLSELLTKGRGVSNAQAGPTVDVGKVLAGIGEGRRDHELFRLACKLRRADIPREWAERLVGEAAAACRPPFPAKEAAAKVASAYGRYRPDPGVVSSVKAETSPFGPLRELPPPRPSVPTLPPDLVPEALRGWLLDITERMQVSLEFAAVPALVALSAVVGRRVGICPKAEDDWLVVPNLWGGIVARPGKMKSPTLAEALRPIQRLARQAQTAHRQIRADQQSRLEALQAKEAALKDLLRQSFKGRKGSRPAEDLEDELRSAHEEYQDLKSSLVERRYVVNDSTIEKLGELLAANPLGLLLVRDELAGWLRALERDDRRGDREFFLEAWNGTGSFTYDRIGRGTLHVPALCMSLIGGIQPAKLSRYVSQALDGGYAADGLLQRFQLLVWPEDHSAWQLIDRPPNTRARDHAFEVYSKLSEMKAGRTAGREIPAWRFSPDAQSLFYAWLSDLEAQVRSKEMLERPAFESHLAKYRSLMPSLALLFELVDGVEAGEAVSLASTRRAAAWCEFLEMHARKVYAAELQTDIEAAHALIAKLRKGVIYSGMTIREIYRHGWARLKTPESVLAGLHVLQQHGWARLESQETGGRSRQILRVNPVVQEAAA